MSQTRKTKAGEKVWVFSPWSIYPKPNSSFSTYGYLTRFYQQRIFWHHLARRTPPLNILVKPSLGLMPPPTHTSKGLFCVGEEDFLIPNLFRSTDGLELETFADWIGTPVLNNRGQSIQEIYRLFLKYREMPLNISNLRDFYLEMFLFYTHVSWVIPVRDLSFLTAVASPAKNFNGNIRFYTRTDNPQDIQNTLGALVQLKSAPQIKIHYNPKKKLSTSAQEVEGDLRARYAFPSNMELHIHVDPDQWKQKEKEDWPKDVKWHIRSYYKEDA